MKHVFAMSPATVSRKATPTGDTRWWVSWKDGVARNVRFMPLDGAAEQDWSHTVYRTKTAEQTVQAQARPVLPDEVDRKLTRESEREVPWACANRQHQDLALMTAEPCCCNPEQARRCAEQLAYVDHAEDMSEHERQVVRVHNAASCALGETGLPSDHILPWTTLRSSEVLMDNRSKARRIVLDYERWRRHSSASKSKLKPELAVMHVLGWAQGHYHKQVGLMAQQPPGSAWHYAGTAEVDRHYPPQPYGDAPVQIWLPQSAHNFKNAVSTNLPPALGLPFSHNFKRWAACWLIRGKIQKPTDADDDRAPMMTIRQAAIQSLRCRRISSGAMSAPVVSTICSMMVMTVRSHQPLFFEYRKFNHIRYDHEKHTDQARAAHQR